MVIGIGNEWREDDAAGLEVARRLRRRAVAGLTVIEEEGEPAGLIEAWAGADRVLVVDAVRSGAAPGTVHRLDPRMEPLPPALFHDSTHALGVAEALELARTLDRLPEHVGVYGIEGGRFGVGRGLSEPVAAAVERVVEELAGLAEPPAAAEFRELAARWGEGDFSGMLERLGHDVRMTAYMPEGEVQLSGREAVLAYLRDFARQWADYRVIAEELTWLSEDTVLLAGTQVGIGRGSGVEISEPLFVVTKLRDGRITASHWHVDRARVLELAGL